MLVLLGLAACGDRSGPPAPVEMNTVSRSPQAMAGARAPAAAVAGGVPAGASASASGTGLALGARDTSYVVQRGDTAYAVARRFDIPVKALIDANNLQPPFGVQAGQHLAIPR